jgi:biotin operon repressor
MIRSPEDPAARQERETGEALRAIAEPRRRKILQLVANDELAAGEIAAAFDITRTAVSQHLTVLKSAGLLSERRDGTRRLSGRGPRGWPGSGSSWMTCGPARWTKGAGSPRKAEGSPMTTRPPAPDAGRLAAGS